MTYKEVATMVGSIGVPFAYYQFPEGTAQDCPFICFFYRSGTVLTRKMYTTARDVRELELLRGIEKLIGRKLPVVEGHPFPMVNFETPKRDKHGKIINAEDAEARQAAREKNAARKKAAAEKAAALKAAQEAAVLAETPAPEKKSKKKKKAKTKVEAVPVVEAPPAPPVKKEKERRTFPHGKQNLGSLQDFLDKQPDPDLAVPYTPHRNPLEGEVIMDATARLLASKPVYRYHTPSKPAPAPEKKEKKAKTKRGKKEEPKAPVSVKSALPKEPERREPPKKGAPAPAKKRSGRKDRIPARVEAPASRQKDSTEQKSLMKPFYISHD